jgi:hypothetical protein
LGVPAIGVVVAFARPGGHRTINVRDHGAIGDGIADDSAAIQRAAAALESDSTLYFPSGTYRFADRNPKEGAAIAIAGISRVTVEFADGAELTMDNIDPDAGTGSSHGILVRGPASDVELRNVTIRWARPATRSMGDGIRIVGNPFALRTTGGWTGTPVPVDGVTLSHCTVQGSPQAGVIMVGVSNIRVSGLRTEDTRADGLHFNACRKAQIEDVTAINPGDDGLALVTYQAPSMSFDTAAQTFSFPDLTRWCNEEFAVANVTVAGGHANGVRLAGSRGVTLAGLNMANLESGAAIMVDSAAPGSDVGWHYVASRGVRVSGVTIDACETGIHILARPTDSADARFTDFDVAIEDAAISNCTNWSVRAESLSAQRATGFSLRSCSVAASSSSGGNGGVGLANTNHPQLDGVSIRHRRSVLAFSAVDTDGLAVDRMAITITDAEPPDGPGPCASFENCAGVVDDLRIGWDAAPDSWSPLHVADDSSGFGQSANARLDIRTVKGA